MTEKSKDKKRKNKKGVKGKKNKRKNQMGKQKKGRKEMNRSSKNSKNYMRYGNSTISSQCFEVVQTAFKRRVTAFNFDNQRKRVEKQTKLVVNKFKKREEFGIVAQKLIKLGGGKKDKEKQEEEWRRRVMKRSNSLYLWSEAILYGSKQLPLKHML